MGILQGTPLCMTLAPCRFHCGQKGRFLRNGAKWACVSGLCGYEAPQAPALWMLHAVGMGRRMHSDEPVRNLPMVRWQMKCVKRSGGGSRRASSAWVQGGGGEEMM